jgi:hypothetical protein
MTTRTPDQWHPLVEVYGFSVTYVILVNDATEDVSGEKDEKHLSCDILQASGDAHRGE